MKIAYFLGLIVISFVLSLSTYGQGYQMNAVELASHARGAARSLSDGGEYEAALKLLNSLETGKYEVGDVATQAAAAKIQGVLTDKGRILIKLKRFSEADEMFYQAFDANIAHAQKNLEYARENGTGRLSEENTKAADAFISASGAVQRANSLIELREASYLLAGAAESAKAFDPARIARLDSLKKGLAKFR